MEFNRIALCASTQSRVRRHNEEHKVIGMLSDGPIIGGRHDNRIQIVRGCPCLKEYGDERICINNDEITPIKPITLDPQFFAQLSSVEDLREFESTKETLCYGLLNLDPRDGNAHCISQGQSITLNQNDIKAEDIRNALDYVVLSGMGSDDVVCSSCLYKYLLTLTDVFGDLVSDEEKEMVIDVYARNLVNRIASDLNQGAETERTTRVNGIHEFSLPTRDNTARRYEEINILSNRQDEEIHNLLHTYQNLQKLEIVFMHQVHALNRRENEGSSLIHLRLMIGTTRKILSLHDELRDLKLYVTDACSLTQSEESVLVKTEQQRQKSEKSFRKLMPLLSKIEVRAE